MSSNKRRSGSLLAQLQNSKAKSLKLDEPRNAFGTAEIAEANIKPLQDWIMDSGSDKKLQLADNLTRDEIRHSLTFSEIDSYAQYCDYVSSRNYDLSFSW